MKQKKQSKSYPKEFKEEAVALVTEQLNVFTGQPSSCAVLKSFKFVQPLRAMEC
ncbi:hypothetical protein Psal006b_01360 [Piscirickettsia salmonis]|uniref:Transposase n=1 Tax=Piscirickettsia salmonis TaxID=1238 RepID=A0AAC9EV19_PISSA|nr:hypothetical protein [Piscirickettsia salmonis]ALB23028.1 transposase [Piscirickettsia salmonis]QGN98370.1 hypothetical protein Psal006b_01360 [Piscirickettsia salmonis]QGO01990.1 hypothetical protein Psal008_01374 [Piscirickettsia salmonis]QGO12677.1 hypothetical protein Psal010b_01357 [Piscirickettsia salmonis]QGO19720.1 hypothetical protein Psal013_01370 [Piscirickettsia salmonis]